jgi:small subunit ribosomal protein S16
MLKIRLRRIGAIRQPHYRIVVADARAPRDGAFIEVLGHYNPLTNPATIQVDVAKYEDWKKKGAQPTNAVVSLVRQFNRTARAAGEGAETPATDRRTRTASGKRSIQETAPAEAAAVATAEAEVPAEAEAAADQPMSEVAAEATRDEGEESAAITEAEPAEEVAAVESAEAETETPETAETTEEA